MKIGFTVLFALLISYGATAGVPEGFSIQKVSSRVKEHKLDSISLETPLDYYLSRAWIRTTGKQKYWNEISTSKFSFEPNAPDESVDDDTRSYILNENIDYIVTYRDSVASVVTHNDDEDMVLLNYCWIEDGRWVNGGQGLADDFQKAEEELLKQLPINYGNLPRISMINDELY